MNNQITHVVSKVAQSRRFRMVMIGLLLLALVLGLAVVPVEVRSGRGGNITSVEDGIWWAITTISGVGYGDRFPVTTTGRLIGIVLEVFGVVLFGSVVAIVSVELMRYQEDYQFRRIMNRLDEMEKKFEEMNRHLDFLVKEKIGKK